MSMRMLENSAARSEIEALTTEVAQHKELQVKLGDKFEPAQAAQLKAAAQRLERGRAPA